MKKIKLLIIFFILIITSGCLNDNSMDNISIATSSYPIKYVVEYLYGNHSTITSIYPLDSNINEFVISDISLEQYNKSDMFIFNGLTDESKYIKSMLKSNKNLKIIDVTSNMIVDYSNEELWLDPSNLLTIANNIKKGFAEYIQSTYLLNEIDQNYELLKNELTKIDGKFYSVARSSNSSTIIVSGKAFKFLEKYGIKVINVDEDLKTEKDINEVNTLISEDKIRYIFTEYKEDINPNAQRFIDAGVENIELYTMNNLKDVNLDQNNYISLMNQNLENLKKELIK